MIMVLSLTNFFFHKHKVHWISNARKFWEMAQNVLLNLVKWACRHNWKIKRRIINFRWLLVSLLVADWHNTIWWISYRCIINLNMYVCMYVHARQEPCLLFFLFNIRLLEVDRGRKEQWLWAAVQWGHGWASTTPVYFFFSWMTCFEYKTSGR